MGYVSALKVIDCVAIYHLHYYNVVGDVIGLSSVNQSIMDNAVGAKAAFPFGGSYSVSKSSSYNITLDTGVFSCGLLYISMLNVSKPDAGNVTSGNLIGLTFMVVAPSMTSTGMTVYDYTNDKLVYTSPVIPSESVYIRLSTTDVTIVLSNGELYISAAFTINGVLLVIS